MFKGIIPPSSRRFTTTSALTRPATPNDRVHDRRRRPRHRLRWNTGESYALTRDERVRQFRFAKEVIGGRVPLICGVNDMTTTGACAYAAAAKEAGADGILLAAPPYSLPTERELAAHCLDVDRACGLPIMLYNYPGRTGVDMGADFLEQVSRRATFKAIKEASGDIDRLHLLACDFRTSKSAAAPRTRRSSSLSGAQRAGSRRWATFRRGGGRFLQRLYAGQGFRQGARHDDGSAAAHVSHRGRRQLRQSVKYAVAFQGLPAGPVRPPMRI